ncbi:MAG TPA: DUF349 domain-containing protein [Vicinamibacterales bacterium]|nr:DUF349 domain-containing protein [Vicinamibacterales bacterium]
MGLLEKLRPQPKHKHADPAVRLEGLHDIDDTDQPALVALATDDADPRVRRAAIGRVTDAAALAGMVRNESDQATRDLATSRLSALAEQPDHAVALSAVTALAALGCQRELAGVARSSALEGVRRSAAEQVTDPRALGSIARHAADPGTRLIAIERLADPAELEAVALRGEHADAAVEALDRLDAPSAELLDNAVLRARTKAVQKRARAIVRLRENAARPIAATPAVEYKDADQIRARELADQMDVVSQTMDMTTMRQTYAALRVAWVELLADAEIQPEHTTRFEQRSDIAREKLQAHEAARAEAERQQQERAREQADRAAVCAEIEALEGDYVPERLPALRAQWDELPPMPETWAGDLQHRYDTACRAAERRHERRVVARQLAEQAPDVVTQVEGFAAVEDYASIRAQWYSLRKQWQQMTRDAEIDPALIGRFDQATLALESKEGDYRDQRVRSQQENLQRLQAAVQELETRAASENLSLKDAEKILKDTKLAVGTMGPLPTKQDREDLTVRLQAVRTTVGPRIKELRDAEEWKRWANVQVQEELCTKMEALIPIAEAEPEKAATEMRALQEKWKSVAAAPRSQAETLWTRFKTAQDQVYDQCKDFFAQQAAERQENLKKKEALSARAEALADSSDWVRTAEAIKQLQAEWKAIGPVTRGHEKAVWERFRTACDRFFTRRQEDLKERKHEWSDNLAKKEVLIAEAEQLAQSTEWDKAAGRIKQLQAEWKKIGPVRKNKSEVVWQRFRGACDTFFERYKTRDQVAIQGKLADREAAVAELEALVPPADATDTPMPEDLYAKVQASRARYLQGPELPRHVLTPLAERVNAALLALVVRWPDAFQNTELDPGTTRRKMEKLVTKIEALLPADSKEPAANLSPAEVLARQWREALAANTMGAAAARQAEEARHRATEQEVRSAQAAWQRLGPLDPAERRPLQDRFDRACRRFFEQKRRHMARA